jgi:5,10-methylenetetrahydromethanopterin reductase
MGQTPVMRISLNGSGQLVLDPTLDGIAADIDRAVEAGFAGYWLAQSGLADALTMLAATAPHQVGPDRAGIEVGTAVVPTFSRHPVTLAGQALTTQAAVPGRLVLGIGLSHRPVVEDRLGLTWERPVRHLRDYLDVLLPLLETGEVHHRGEIWSGEVAMPRPTDRVPSVMVAALGPQMLDLAGRRTDGTILWLVGPRTIREHVAPRLGDAAAAAHRPAPRVVCSLPLCVTDDPAGARDLIGRVLAGYGELPSYRAMLDREGADGPGDVAVVGDEAAVDAALDELAEAGVTDFAPVPIALDPELHQRSWAVLRARAAR